MFKPTLAKAITKAASFLALAGSNLMFKPTLAKAVTKAASFLALTGSSLMFKPTLAKAVTKAAIFLALGGGSLMAMSALAQSPAQTSSIDSLLAQAPPPEHDLMQQALDPLSPVPQSQQLPGMMQQAADPLEQLRDIRQPDPFAETWPAPGWWLLSLMLAVGSVMALVQLYRYWRGNRYRREAMKELQALYAHWQRHGTDRQNLHELQSLLKRTALTGFRREQVAALTGETWLAFLDESSGTSDFSLGDAAMVNALIDGNYRQAQESNIQVLQLQTLAEHWVKRHHPKHLKSSARFASDFPGAKGYKPLSGATA